MVILRVESSKKQIKKNLLTGRYGHACFVIENMVYIYSDMDDGLCDDALQLDVIQNKWKRKKYRGNIPSREFFSFAQTSNQLYLEVEINNKIKNQMIYMYGIITQDKKSNNIVLQDKKSILYQKWFKIAGI